MRMAKGCHTSGANQYDTHRSLEVFTTSWCVPVDGAGSTRAAGGGGTIAAAAAASGVNGSPYTMRLIATRSSLSGAFMS